MEQSDGWCGGGSERSRWVQHLHELVADGTGAGEHVPQPHVGGLCTCRRRLPLVSIRLHHGHPLLHHTGRLDRTPTHPACVMQVRADCSVRRSCSGARVATPLELMLAHVLIMVSPCSPAQVLARASSTQPGRLTWEPSNDITDADGEMAG